MLVVNNPGIDMVQSNVPANETDKLMNTVECSAERFAWFE
jgi:hypothetical protein